MTNQKKIISLYCQLKVGIITIQQFVAYADELILSTQNPESILLDVSLLKNKPNELFSVLSDFFFENKITFPQQDEEVEKDILSILKTKYLTNSKNFADEILLPLFKLGQSLIIPIGFENEFNDWVNIMYNLEEIESCEEVWGTFWHEDRVEIQKQVEKILEISQNESCIEKADNVIVKVEGKVFTVNVEKTAEFYKTFVSEEEGKKYFTKKNKWENPPIDLFRNRVFNTPKAYQLFKELNVFYGYPLPPIKDYEFFFVFEGKYLEDDGLEVDIEFDNWKEGEKMRFLQIQFGIVNDKISKKYKIPKGDWIYMDGFIV